MPAAKLVYFGIVFAAVVVRHWGLHMGLTKGLLSALVAKMVPAELTGTAYEMFNLITGAALLLASVIAGGLWQSFGSTATFLAGAAFALVAALGVLPLRRRLACVADVTCFVPPDPGRSYHKAAQTRRRLNSAEIVNCRDWLADDGRDIDLY